MPTLYGGAAPETEEEKRKKKGGAPEPPPAPDYRRGPRGFRGLPDVVEGLPDLSGVGDVLTRALGRSRRGAGQVGRGQVPVTAAPARAVPPGGMLKGGTVPKPTPEGTTPPTTAGGAAPYLPTRLKTGTPGETVAYPATQAPPPERTGTRGRPGGMIGMGAPPPPAAAVPAGAGPTTVPYPGAGAEAAAAAGGGPAPTPGPSPGQPGRITPQSIGEDWTALGFGSAEEGQQWAEAFAAEHGGNYPWEEGTMSPAANLQEHVAALRFGQEFQGTTGRAPEEGDYRIQWFRNRFGLGSNWNIGGASRGGGMGWVPSEYMKGG